MVKLVWDRKYDETGNKSAPIQVVLPFQTIETLNESSQQRQKSIELFLNRRTNTEWRNRLIWGDKKYVLLSFLPEFANSIDLIYIDPPFGTGADFSYTVEVPDHYIDATSFQKLPSVIEQKAYRDTWGKGETQLDSYLHWFYETLFFLEKLLKPTGSIYIHLDWHIAHYAKVVADEVFGKENFRDEIYWYYYNKMHDRRKGLFPKATDSILFYVKDVSSDFTFNLLEEPREKSVKQLARKKVNGRMVNVKDAQGELVYRDRDKRIVDNVWRISMLQPADKTEKVPFPTQKPEALLQRVINASSKPGHLMLDCFCGSGTSAVVAEKSGLRWIACDLSRFAIHTTRKRLLGIPGIKPFVIQNLGKYERQAWQATEFGSDAVARIRSYLSFVLELYGAKPLNMYVWLHGIKGRRFVHVGSVDSPISPFGRWTNCC